MFVYGKPLTGKTTLCRILANKLGYKIIEWKTFEEKVKKSMGTDEEPYEGEVPAFKIQEALFGFIKALKGEARTFTYVVDGALAG